MAVPGQPRQKLARLHLNQKLRLGSTRLQEDCGLRSPQAKTQDTVQNITKVKEGWGVAQVE
jgi:hypothetical protein